MALENCEPVLNCETAKLSWDQIFKRYILTLVGNCLAIKTVSISSGEAIITSPIETVSGSVAAGALAVTFTTSDDFVGSINGAARLAGFSYVFDTKTKTTPTIPYVITAGSITIDKIV